VERRFVLEVQMAGLLRDKIGAEDVENHIGDTRLKMAWAP